MKREFVISRHGKDYVLYAGLLDEAHQQGLKAIKTQLIQAPAATNGNVAICFAEVLTEKGTFTGIGDAEPANVSRAMVTALIRLAETRAKARALRDAVNVSMLSIEELAESTSESLAVDDEEGAAAPPAPRPVAPPPPLPVALDAARSRRLREAPTRAERPDRLERPTPSERAEHPERVERLERAPHAERVERTSTTDTSASSALVTAGVAAESGSVAAEASPTARRGRSATSTVSPSGTISATGTSGPAIAEERPIPATQTQLETIAKLARSVGRPVPTGELSRAAASELISRLSEERYGARRGS